LLEFNHDLALLQSGSYPAALKRRVGGDYGHLNNQQAAELLKALDNSQLKLLAIGHLSEQNNSPAHAQAALAQVSHCHRAEVFMACQQEGFDWLYLADELRVSAAG
jgi:phosphoribosyl 1,2-cyclic phosphodiesterase